jgi:hypothetical protein
MLKMTCRRIFAEIVAQGQSAMDMREQANAV